MTKAIIFDCFGVLVTDAWIPFKDKYFGDNSELYEEASDIAKRANRGLMSQDDFIREAAELAGVSVAEAVAFISRNVADEKLFEYMRELKQNYKLGFLSNIAGNYLSRMFTEEQLSLFDVIEMSYESGFIKPEPEAFTHMAKRLGVDVSEAVLVDDLERNVTGAKDAGMQAILYTDLEQLKRDLAPFTGS